MPVGEGGAVFVTDICNEICQGAFRQIPQRTPRFPLQRGAQAALRIVDLNNCGGAGTNAGQIMFGHRRLDSVDRKQTDPSHN